MGVGMEINPIIPLAWLVLLAVGILPFSGILAWRSSRLCTLRRRLVIVAARLLGVACLLLLALNPGYWQRHLETLQGEWALLLDYSTSMATPDAGNGQARWTEARRLARLALEVPDAKTTAAVFTVADTLNRVSPDAIDTVQPDGSATRITDACRRLLERYHAEGRTLTGILLLSDGRQVPPADPVDVAALARARQVPIHTVTLGGTLPRRDLAVRFRRSRAVAFTGQESRLTADVTATGLTALRTDVTLLDRDGNRLASQSVELAGNAATATVTFAVSPAVKGYAPYTLSVPAQTGEQDIQNNADRMALLVLDQPIRILSVEGLPHWDSKFLLQLLHRQTNVEVTSLYRLTAERFFRVQPGRLQAEDGDSSDFPDDADALLGYDLIVFGKGAEYFLTPARIALLRRFVSEQGGGILFARGKPYTREFPELAAMEPLAWGERTGTEGRLRPTAAGEDAGLFGDALPGKDDPRWQQLPPLRDMHRAAALSPFTQVLAETAAETAGATPLILARRLGQGVVVTVNAGDFWKWDFFPDESESHAMYTAIWSQLLQWIITYAEFLPGESGALRLSPPAVLPGEPVRTVIHTRYDAGAAGDLLLRVVGSGERPVLEIMAGGSVSGRRDAVFSLVQPGDYHVEAVDPATGTRIAHPVALRVLAPPAEGDNLDADPEFMRLLASHSGGTVATEENLPATVAAIQPENRLVPLEQAVWQPLWNRALILVLIALVISIEWIVRRRGGLA